MRMSKPDKFPVIVKRGSVAVKIYYTPTKGRDSFTLAYWHNGKRNRPTFSDFSEAKREAEKIALQLTSGDLDVLTLTSADRASYLRARQLLDPLGISLESAAAELAEAKKALGSVPLSRAAEYYLKRHPSNIKPRLVSDVVVELLVSKRGDGLSEGYLQHLRYDLGKFSSSFQCSITSITGNEIDQWLRSLAIKPRTRNNLRTSVQTLFSYAKARKYLPKDHDELDAVSVAKDRDGDIEIFTPNDLETILQFAKPHLTPFLVLAAFAGIRHAEIQRLEWEDIKFDDDIIEIRSRKAKTASRRTIPILDNLKQWLSVFRKSAGPICTRRNIADEITTLVKDINQVWQQEKPSRTFTWKHNGLRHSFISYRVAQIQNVQQVALEAGNSPQIIFKHYRELVRPADAVRWFSITPEKVIRVVGAA